MTLRIPGFTSPASGTYSKVSFGPAPACSPITGAEVLEQMLALGLAQLNTAEHPIPSFDFYCVAPDVEGYGTDNETLTLILHGKRVGRIVPTWGTETEASGFEMRVWTSNRTEMLGEPEEIAPGTLVMLPDEKDAES